jgi:hypothetical protein
MDGESKFLGRAEEGTILIHHQELLNVKEGQYAVGIIKPEGNDHDAFTVVRMPPGTCYVYTVDEEGREDGATEAEMTYLLEALQQV